MFKDSLNILLIAALAATAITLILGVLNLFREKKGHEEQSNKLMRLRIFFQASALILLAILFFMKGK
jgi:hypothetical protein